MTRIIRLGAELANGMRCSDGEDIVVDARCHGIVLVPPLSRAAVIAGLGALGVSFGGIVAVVGALLLIVAGTLAAATVVRWDRTHVVLTTEKLFVVHGVLRRRAAAVRLRRIGAVEVEQTLIGRVLGYGTIVAGDLEIPYVPEPQRVSGLVGRLAG
jgi:hypothetical protein